MIVYEQVTRVGNTELTRRLEVDGQSRGKAADLAAAFFPDDEEYDLDIADDIRGPELEAELEGVMTVGEKEAP